MLIKLDECIPGDVSTILSMAGHEVHTVHQEHLSGASDAEVWQAAQTEKRFLITTDLDFSNIRKHKPETHHGILLLRLGKEGKKSITSVIRWIVEHHAIETWSGSLVVASDHALRIKRPQ